MPLLLDRQFSVIHPVRNLFTTRERGLQRSESRLAGARDKTPAASNLTQHLRRRRRFDVISADALIPFYRVQKVGRWLRC